MENIDRKLSKGFWVTIIGVFIAAIVLAACFSGEVIDSIGQNVDSIVLILCIGAGIGLLIFKEHAPGHEEEKAAVANARLISVIIYCIVVFGIWLLRSSSIISFAGSKDAAFRMCALWALGWFSIGFLFGFIFGFPKADSNSSSSTTNQSGSSNSNTASSNSQSAATSPRPTSTVSVLNQTSLASIVDWLTKIIVGVSLVELKSLYRAFKSASLFVAQSISANATPPNDAISFAGSIILLFMVLGFLGGFLITMLYLKGAIESAAPLGFQGVFDVSVQSGLASTAGLNQNVIASPVISNPADPAAESIQIKDFWRPPPNQTVNPQNETLLLDWIKRNCPGRTILDLIYLQELADFRKRAVKELISKST